MANANAAQERRDEQQWQVQNAITAMHLQRAADAKREEAELMRRMFGPPKPEPDQGELFDVADLTDKQASA